MLNRLKLTELLENANREIFGLDILDNVRYSHDLGCFLAYDQEFGIWIEVQGYNLAILLEGRDVVPPSFSKRRKLKLQRNASELSIPQANKCFRRTLNSNGLNPTFVYTDAFTIPFRDGYCLILHKEKNSWSLSHKKTSEVDLRDCFFMEKNLQVNLCDTQIDDLRGLCKRFNKSQNLDEALEILMKEYCPMFDEFLSRCFSYYQESDTKTRVKLTLLKTIVSQVIRSTSEDFNYCHLQKIVVISGLGGSGKSALCEIIQSLFSSATSSPCALSSRFENSRFVGTSAIFFSELPHFDDSSWGQVLSTFKQLSGKDLIPYEFKYGKLSSFRFYGTVFVTSNSPFKSNPRDEFISIERRLLPFYFMSGIEPSKMDAEFAQKIISKESLTLKLIGFLCKDHLESITLDLNNFYLPLLLLDNKEPSIANQVDPLLAFAYQELDTCKRKVEQPLLAKDLVTGFLHYLSMSFSDDPQIYDLRGYYEAIRLSLESTLGWSKVNGLKSNNLDHKGNLNSTGRISGAGLVKLYLSSGHIVDQNVMGFDAMKVFTEKLRDRLIVLEKHRPNDFKADSMKGLVLVDLDSVVNKEDLKIINPYYAEMTDEQFDKVQVPKDRVRVYPNLTLNENGFLANSEAFKLSYTGDLIRLFQEANNPLKIDNPLQSELRETPLVIPKRLTRKYLESLAPKQLEELSMEIISEIKTLWIKWQNADAKDKKSIRSRIQTLNKTLDKITGDPSISANLSQNR